MTFEFTFQETRIEWDSVCLITALTCCPRTSAGMAQNMDRGSMKRMLVLLELIHWITQSQRSGLLLGRYSTVDWYRAFRALLFSMRLSRAGTSWKACWLMYENLGLFVASSLVKSGELGHVGQPHISDLAEVVLGQVQLGQVKELLKFLTRPGDVVTLEQQDLRVAGQVPRDAVTCELQGRGWGREVRALLAGAARDRNGVDAKPDSKSCDWTREKEEKDEEEGGGGVSVRVCDVLRSLDLDDRLAVLTQSSDHVQNSALSLLHDILSIRDTHADPNTQETCGPSMEAVALFSYTASEAGEISVRKGDVIKVTDMEDDSHWFTAEVQGKRGYCDSVSCSSSGSAHSPSGVFLVRASESAPGEFSLSVSYGDMVEHFRVLEGAGQYCIWEESFCSLNRLVDFYRSHSIAVERAVYLRDLPSNAPQQTAESSRNPYPNPYEPRRPPSHPSPPEREASSRASEPASG
ncbi:hypothetical protein CRUP_016289, partial [Coryphaenoides rupestris]